MRVKIQILPRQTKRTETGLEEEFESLIVKMEREGEHRALIGGELARSVCGGGGGEGRVW